MKTPTHLENRPHEIVPGILVKGIGAIVPIKDVPALERIVREDIDTTQVTDSIFPPARSLVLHANPDGTYATLNNLETIYPEASRVSSTQVRALVVDFSENTPEEQENVRAFLLHVEPYRQLENNLSIVEMAFKGVYDKLATLYGGPNKQPGKFAATAALFLRNQLSRSTFQRIFSELTNPNRKVWRKIKNQLRKNKISGPDRRPEGDEKQNDLFPD